jgi:hypothetical protein
MRNRLAWMAGALGAAGVAYRAVRRRRASDRETVEDPRADELRRKLDESKTIVDERGEFEGGETALDEAEPATVDEKRAAAHERARAAAEDMRSREG